MDKGFYAGTGKKSFNVEQGRAPTLESKPEGYPSEPFTLVLTPAERTPFIVPAQEYDMKALGDAMKAFHSERGDPIDTFSGPVRYQNGSTNQILAACLAYHAAASKAEAVDGSITRANTEAMADIAALIDRSKEGQRKRDTARFVIMLAIIAVANASVFTAWKLFGMPWPMFETTFGVKVGLALFAVSVLPAFIAAREIIRQRTKAREFSEGIE